MRYSQTDQVHVTRGMGVLHIYERASFPSGMNSSYFFGEFSLLSTQSREMRLFFAGTQLSSYSLSSVPGERLPKHKRSIFSLLLLLRSLFQRPESPAVKTTGNLGWKTGQCFDINRQMLERSEREFFLQSSSSWKQRTHWFISTSFENRIYAGTSKQMNTDQTDVQYPVWRTQFFYKDHKESLKDWRSLFWRAYLARH